MQEFTQNEIWKDIKNYEGYYQISSLGRVKSLKRFATSKRMTRCVPEKILKQAYDNNNYCAVSLFRNAKRETVKVHRLVALHFIENTYNKPQVNHIDNNHKNNNVKNLEWVTQSENIQHAYDNGHMFTQKINQIDIATGTILATYKNVYEAQKLTGVTRSCIYEVCAKQKGRKQASGFKWEFANK